MRAAGPHKGSRRVGLSSGAHAHLAAGCGFVADPGVPSAVIGDVHAVLFGAIVQKFLKLSQKMGVHQFRMVREMGVQHPVNELQFIKRMGGQNGLPANLKSHWNNSPVGGGEKGRGLIAEA